MTTDNFLTNYLNETKSRIDQAIPGLDPLKLEALIRKEMKQSLKLIPVKLENQDTNVLELVNFMLREKPIVTGFGALYRRHDQSENTLSEMVDMLLKDRKKWKNIMFQHVNDADRSAYENAMMTQLTLKLLANSFYGASIEKNCIFYNPYFGPSITYTGVIIITTAVNIFEKFVANNIIFRDVNDISNYIYNIVNENNDIELTITNKSKEDLSKYLMSKVKDPMKVDSSMVDFLLSGLSQRDLNRIFYKNNLNNMIEECVELKVLVGKVIGQPEFLDPNEPPKILEEAMDTLWDILNKWCYYDKLDFYRFQNAHDEVREAILTIDTDSTFIYCQPFVDMCFKSFGLEDNSMNRMTTTNVAGWLMGQVIASNYALMTKQMGIPEAKRPIINMKNEFYYSRLMLTRNKKNYGGIIAAQEGNVLEKPKMDVKGLAIRKVSTNREVREYFTEFLKEDILTGNISLSNVISKFQKLENKIRESLQKGEIDFLKPDKVNSIDSYKNPYTMMSVRGTILWNALYPAKEISIPNKINIVKTTLDTVEEIENSDIPQQFKDILINELSDESMGKYGAKVIAIPKTEKEIPSWLIPYIDFTTMVNDNMTPGIILLESLGFRNLTVNSKQMATNVINL